MRRRQLLVAAGAAAALAAGSGPASATGGRSTATTAAGVRGAGRWVTNPSITSMPAARYETEHFALRWRGEDVRDEVAREGGTYLEEAWAHFMTSVGWPEPYAGRTTKFRVDVHVDPTFGLTGGTSPEGGMAAWVDPGSLQDPFGLAHELTHALQGATGGLQGSPYTGFFWETHANFMATRLPRYRTFLHGSEMLVNYPHQHYGTTRNHYLSFMFLEHLQQRYGAKVINDIWSSAPRSGTAQAEADPWSVLMRRQGWSLSQLNDVFGDWAARQVTFDHGTLDGVDRGALMRRTYGSYDDVDGDRRLRVTELDLLDDRTRTYGVPFTWAPQRWGYNLVRLVPDAGATQVAVGFTGHLQSAPAVRALPGWPNEPTSVPRPAPGWRWSVVAVDAAGRPRYSGMQRSDRGRVTVRVRAGDKGLYLVVLGAPRVMEKIRFDQPAYSLYRYPWQVQLSGARADDGSRALRAAHPGVRRHVNGGGWVDPGASVADSAYVGPHARVLGGRVQGSARLEGRATVLGGTVRGRALVRGTSVVRGSALVEDRAVVDTTFRGVGAYRDDVHLAGTAHALGDLELLAGETVSRGAFYGFVDDAVLRDGPGRTATGPVPEVTRRPTWART